MGCLLACFQWLSWKYRLDLLRHVVFIKENLFLIQTLFILRLLDTIGSQITFFLNFYRNLPQYPCCSIGVRSLFRQPIIPTAHCSDSPFLRKPIIPSKMVKSSIIILKPVVFLLYLMED